MRMLECDFPGAEMTRQGPSPLSPRSPSHNGSPTMVRSLPGFLIRSKRSGDDGTVPGAAFPLTEGIFIAAVIKQL